MTGEARASRSIGPLRNRAPILSSATTMGKSSPKGSLAYVYIADKPGRSSAAKFLS